MKYLQECVITVEMQNTGLEDVSEMFTDKITDIALSMKAGTRSYEFPEWTGNFINVKIEASTDDLLLERADVNEEFAVTLIYKFTIKLDSQFQLSDEAEEAVK